MAVPNIFESNAPQVGDRATETAHRKIELQSPADLTYLIANVSRAAREKIDKHLPPDAAPGSEDPMRKRVEQLVDDYIRETFGLAKNSISINGMDSQEVDAELAKAQEGEELEPFDSKLAQRIQALSAQIEDRTLQMANLRRKVPQQTAQDFLASFDKQAEEYDERLKMDLQTRLDTAKSTKISVGQINRADEIEHSYQKGSEDLRALQAGLGDTVSKMERAQRAANVVEGR